MRQQLPVTPDNQRSVLGRALSLVRFPLMSMEEFASGPGQSGLLTDKEVTIIIFKNFFIFLFFKKIKKPNFFFFNIFLFNKNIFKSKTNLFKNNI